MDERHRSHSGMKDGMQHKELRPRRTHFLVSVASASVLDPRNGAVERRRGNSQMERRYHQKAERVRSGGGTK